MDCEEIRVETNMNRALVPVVQVVSGDGCVVVRVVAWNGRGPVIAVFPFAEGNPYATFDKDRAIIMAKKFIETMSWLHYDAAKSLKKLDTLRSQ